MKDLMTTSEAAVALGVNASRVRQLILADRLPAIKRGRDLFVKPADLEKVRVRTRTGRPKKVSD